MAEIRYSGSERPTTVEWLEFLRRSDLGPLYPKQRFAERFRRMVRNVDVVVTARDGDLIVGLCAGLTDFAYFLFLTDLGVARGYERRGIARRLVDLAIESAGGRRDVCAVTWSNRKALDFYGRCGLAPVPTLVGRECDEWEPLDVDAVAREDVEAGDAQAGRRTGYPAAAAASGAGASSARRTATFFETPGSSMVTP